MGDAGEGLVDAEARIQERLEEMARERAERAGARVRDAEAQRRVESIRLTRADLLRQLNATGQSHRRTALADVLADLDRQMAEAQAALVTTA